MSGGVFNAGLEWWQLLLLMIGSALSIVVVRIAISFDINKFLDRRDKKLQQKLRNACTHLDMNPIGREGNEMIYKVQSLFESPPGTIKWRCRRCGAIKNHDNDYEERANYYAQHPKEYIKQQKRFNKLIKKAGYI